MTSGTLSVRVDALEGLAQSELQSLFERSGADISALEDYVRPIIARVKSEGDDAVRDLTRQFDHVDLGRLPLRATPAEFDEAEAELPASLLRALDFAITNLRKGHTDQLRPPLIRTDIAEGVVIGERTLPLNAVGLYVPRGKGSFPSVVTMLAVPAIVAGVKRPVIVTPPGPGGLIDPATLAAARRCGVTEVYRVGGVQAIAALAHGTQSIPRVPKVVGPGNAYVAAAKRVLAGLLDPGVPAGPSESIVYYDGCVSPRIAAADLLVEAEHGGDSCAVLIAASRRDAEAVANELPALVADLPAVRREFISTNFVNRSRILWTESEQDAIAFINAFAPEHLLLLTRDPERLLPDIENAGEVMMGAYAPIPLGNFVAGTNAVLPTGGLARSASCLGVADFQKRSSFVSASEVGFNFLAPAALELADYEGFPAHANALRARMSGTSL